MNNKTNPGTPSPQNPNDKFRRFLRSPWIYPLLFAVLVLLLSFFGQQRTAVTKEIPYSEFLTMLRDNQVQAVEVSGDKLTIQPKGSNNLSAPLYYTTRIISDSALVEAAYYPADRTLVALNNSEEPVSATIALPDGSLDVTLNPMETRMIQL